MLPAENGYGVQAVTILLGCVRQGFLLSLPSHLVNELDVIIFKSTRSWKTRYHLLQTESTMASSTRQAMQLNNLGAQQLAAGELGSALEAFRSALSFVSAHASFEEQNPPPVAIASPSLGIVFMHVSRVEDDESSPYSSCQPFVYQKPLIFNQILPGNQDGTAAFCATVVFNMALTFERKGTNCGNKTCISKALQLYESSIDLFSKTSSRVDMSSVISAAINNKARIYFDYCNFEGSSHELERLHKFMAMADQCPNSSDILAEDDFQGILLNLLLLRPPVAAQAAWSFGWLRFCPSILYFYYIS